MKIKKIGLVISALDSFTQIELYKGIKNQAEALGYVTCVGMVIQSTELSKYFCQGEYHLFDLLDMNEFDGFIVALNTISNIETRLKIRERIEKTGKPVVAIDCEIENGYRITTRNRNAQAKLVEHLITEHHLTKINYISGPFTNEEALDRRDAYIEVMEKYGLSYENRIFEGTFYVNDGKASLDAFDQDEQASDYEAIVCANDKAALSVYEELMKRGKRIPEDVAVTGFDDIDEATSFVPLLTTVTKRERMIGEKSVQVLEDVFAGKAISDNIIIDAEPVYRQSCGCHMSEHDMVRNINSDIFYYAENHTNELQTRACTEGCIDADNFEEYITNIKNFILKVNPQEFYFCLFENYTNDFKIKKTITLKTAVKENDGKLIVPIAYRNGEFLGSNVETGAIRNFMDVYEMNSQQYVVSPVHFRNKNYGVVIFAGSWFPFTGSYYMQWVTGINNTLNGLRDRMKLNELYRKDSLTGLYNRHGLTFHYGRMDEECRANHLPMLFLFVDVDGLKYINDNFGHEQGDYTIRTVANAVLAVDDDRLVATRYGGDEFLVLGKNMTEADGRKLERAIYENLIHSNEFKAKPFTVSASIGVFVKEPDDVISFDDCVKLADDVMYRKKKRKKELQALSRN